MMMNHLSQLLSQLQHLIWKIFQNSHLIQFNKKWYLRLRLLMRDRWSPRERSRLSSESSLLRSDKQRSRRMSSLDLVWIRCSQWEGRESSKLSTERSEKKPFMNSKILGTNLHARALVVEEWKLLLRRSRLKGRRVRSKLSSWQNSRNKLSWSNWSRWVS